MSDTPNLDALLTPEQVYQLRKGSPIPKGKSRLQVTEDAKPLTVVSDAQFKKTVRAVARWDLNGLCSSNANRRDA